MGRMMEEASRAWAAAFVASSVLIRASFHGLIPTECFLWEWCAAPPPLLVGFPPEASKSPL